jgi:hypothetical protein
MCTYFLCIYRTNIICYYSSRQVLSADKSCPCVIFPEPIDWLIIYYFTSRSRIFHYCRWRAAKFRLLGAQGLWAGRDLYRVTPAVTRDIGFFGLIRMTAPFSRLLRHAWGCGGPILTRILTGLPSRRQGKYETQTTFISRYYLSGVVITILSYFKSIYRNSNKGFVRFHQFSST